jgi:hypothetical protein
VTLHPGRYHQGLSELFTSFANVDTAYVEKQPPPDVTCPRDRRPAARPLGPSAWSKQAHGVPGPFRRH